MVKQQENNRSLICVFYHKTPKNYGLKVTPSREAAPLRPVKTPYACIGVFDPRGSRQMDMRACPLGSLLAGIKKERPTQSIPFVFA